MGLSNKKDKFYITTPIFYVNGPPHIGHAYAAIAADAQARWHRLKGEDVFFLTGTDEHGEKIEDAAKTSGKSPQEFADDVSARFREAWNILNISYNDFIRTTEPRHVKVVQEFINRLGQSGDLYKGDYEGWYCIPCETFWTELQLENDCCPDCDRPVEKIKEEAYFFKLSKYRDPLLKHYIDHPRFLLPTSRAREVIARVEDGLRDLCITRKTIRWGIQFPLEAEHVVYVWLDALINYLSALDWPTGERYKRYWPADIHLVGKEINWFHSVIWPALLLSAGEKLPNAVFSHGWWTVNGEKMSKSKGNVVDPFEVVESYPVDAFRYFLLREMAFGDDGDYSAEALKRRINGELVSDLGNLLNRVLTLAERYNSPIRGEDELSNSLHLDLLGRHMGDLQYHLVLGDIWELIRAANRYANMKQPWKLTGSELGKVLYNLLESLRVTAILLSPFMPATSDEMNRQLGTSPGGVGDLSFRKEEWKGKVRRGRYLFQKV
jgi:methionyl-tRNA synthetase